MERGVSKQKKKSKLCVGTVKQINKQTTWMEELWNFGIHSISLFKSAGGAWSRTKEKIFVLLTPCRLTNNFCQAAEAARIIASLEQMFFTRI